MFWVPQTGSIGLGISILSYNGRVHFGFIADSKCVPDPDEVIRRFAPEFEKLLLITLMEDWDEDITSADAAATLLRFAEGEAPPPDDDSRADSKATPARRLRGRSRLKPVGGIPGDASGMADDHGALALGYARLAGARGEAVRGFYVGLFRLVPAGAGEGIGRWLTRASTTSSWACRRPSPRW